MATPAYLERQLDGLNAVDRAYVLDTVRECHMTRVTVTRTPLLTVTGRAWGDDIGFTRLPCGTTAEAGSPAAAQTIGALS